MSIFWLPLPLLVWISYTLWLDPKITHLEMDSWPVYLCMLVSVCTQVTSPVHIRPDQTAASQVCDTLSSKAAHEREESLQKDSICYGRVAFLCVAIEHTNTGILTSTRMHCCIWNKMWWRFRLRESIQYMLLKMKGEFSLYISYVPEIQLKYFSTLPAACTSSAFPILLYSTWCMSRRGRVDFKQSCPIEQHITALPALPLKNTGQSMLSGIQSISHYGRLLWQLLSLWGCALTPSQTREHRRTTQCTDPSYWPKRQAGLRNFFEYKQKILFLYYICVCF